MPHADVAVRKAYMKVWNERHRESKKAYNREYQASHRDQINAKSREWKARNRDRVKELSHRDYQKHKAQRDAKHREYRQTHDKEVKVWLRKWRRESTAHKIWREKHRDYMREKSKAYRRMSNPKYRRYIDANRSRLNEINRNWRRTSEVHKNWLAKNKDRLRVNAMKHYLRYRDTFREYMRSYNILKPRRVAIYVKWSMCGELCYICGEKVLIDKTHIDHVIPVAKGGTNDIDNLMPTHGPCNNEKKHKLDFPVARPDLVELTKGIETVPRKPPRTGGTRAARLRMYEKQSRQSRTAAAR